MDAFFGLIHKCHSVLPTKQKIHKLLNTKSIVEFSQVIRGNSFPAAPLRGETSVGNKNRLHSCRP